MRKIPRLLVKDKETDKLVFNDGMECVQGGNAIATLKYDGSATCMIDGKFYKRYDLKKGQPLPDGAIACQDRPYDGTTHFPVWKPCDLYDPADKWYNVAYLQTDRKMLKENGNWSYEAVGPHFQDNPYGLEYDQLLPHGKEVIIPCPTTIEGIKKWLEENYQEGIVYWFNGEPVAKIRRKDFNIPWPIRNQTAKVKLRE